MEEIEHNIRQFCTAKENHYFDRKSARINVADAAKHVVAFANAAGGRLVIGIEDNGTLTGFKRNGAHAAEDFEQIPITMCEPSPVVNAERVSVTNVQGGDDFILVLNVECSADAVIKQRSDGRVALREGDKSVWLDHEQIVALERDKGQSYFENDVCQDSSLVDIDPEAVEIYKKALGTTISDEKLLGAMRFERGGKLTNAGVLLFAKEPSWIFPQARLRVLKIDGTEMRSGAHMNIIKDRTFDGPLVKALPAARDFIASQLRDFQFQQKGGNFTVIPEYPEFAWFESLVNAMAHRDYSIRGEYARVYIYDDRMEVFSPGRLPNIVTVDNIRHTRFSRNPQICRVFTAFEWVRELNEGIDKIYEVMEEQGLPAPVLTEENDFAVRMTLYNNIEQRIPRLQEGENANVADDRTEGLTDRELAILQIESEEGRVTTKIVVAKLGISRQTAANALKNLESKKVLVWHGASRNDPQQYYSRQ